MKRFHVGPYFCFIMEKEGSVNTGMQEFVWDETKKQTEKNGLSDTLEEIDWAELFQQIILALENLNNRYCVLKKQESNADKRVSDILHYAEFCEVESDEEIKSVWNLLRKDREDRRRAKDEQQIITWIRQLGLEELLEKTKKISKKIENMESRIYTPRVHRELFEDAEWRQKERVEENTYEEEREAEEMTAGRRETPLDGKENDWLNFAKQQADFYRFAGQYMINLKTDIAELKEKIDEILSETEKANYNGAQGYDVYIRLKKCMREKTEKETELQCVRILTERIYCEELADVSEENYQQIKKIKGVPEETSLHLVKGGRDIAG